MDATEIYSKRLNAKEEIFPEENGKFTLPAVERRITLSGRDQDLRTPTSIRERPIREEGHIDFLGESEGSLPPPHDSFPDAGEAINDFWSMPGNFIYRHHVEPRVKLYSPREESFPIPLKYIDVTRTTHTNLDVKQEKRIDDYWNIDGSRDLSDPWTSFTQFTLLDEKAPDGYTWSGGRLTRKQLTSRPDHLWPELWRKLGRNAQLMERQKWAKEKPKLDNARKLRGIYFIDPEVKEFKETIKNGHMKSPNSIMPEDYGEFISLTLRTRNSKKPSRMLARTWKRQWLLLCLAKQARNVSMERPVAKPMSSNPNMRVSWKRVNPQDCVWKNLYQHIMRTILQERETIHCNIII